MKITMPVATTDPRNTHDEVGVQESPDTRKKTFRSPGGQLFPDFRSIGLLQPDCGLLLIRQHSGALPSRPCTAAQGAALMRSRCLLPCRFVIDMLRCVIRLCAGGPSGTAVTADLFRASRLPMFPAARCFPCSHPARRAQGGPIFRIPQGARRRRPTGKTVDRVRRTPRLRKLRLFPARGGMRRLDRATLTPLRPLAFRRPSDRRNVDSRGSAVRPPGPGIRE